MGKHKCPNCGHPLRTVIYSDEKRSRGNGSKPGQFQSTASMPPLHYGRIRSFLWHMNPKNKYNPEWIQERIIVRSEYKPNPRQELINQIDGLSLTVSEIKQLAHTYVGLGLSWSKATTTQHCSLIGGGKHDNIKNDFLQLGFLEDVGEGKKILYQLTEMGTRFLTYYLDTTPPTRRGYWDVLTSIRGGRSQSMTVNDG